MLSENYIQMHNLVENFSQQTSCREQLLSISFHLFWKVSSCRPVVDRKSMANPFGTISSSMHVFRNSTCSFILMFFSFREYTFHPRSVGFSVIWGFLAGFAVSMKLADGVTSSSLLCSRSSVRSSVRVLTPSSWFWFLLVFLCFLVEAIL